MNKKKLLYPQGVDIWVHDHEQRFFEGKKIMNVFNVAIAQDEVKRIDFKSLISLQNPSNGKNLAIFEKAEDGSIIRC